MLNALLMSAALQKAQKAILVRNKLNCYSTSINSKREKRFKEGNFCTQNHSCGCLINRKLLRIAVKIPFPRVLIHVKDKHIATCLICLLYGAAFLRMFYDNYLFAALQAMERPTWHS